MSSLNHLTKVIFIPGNGSGSCSEHWFPYLQEQLHKLNIKVIAKHFPDPILARAEYWLPYIKKLGADENTILVGHSTGATAAMRYAENNKLWASVLVAPSCTHFNDPYEMNSGYFDKPWDWEKIKENQKWITLFSSDDDPYIPLDESDYIAHQLACEYYTVQNGGHLGDDVGLEEFPEIVETLKRKLVIE